MMYQTQMFDCNQYICSLDWAQTSYANANTDANRIRNKNMSPTPTSPTAGETKSILWQLDANLQFPQLIGAFKKLM